MKDENINKDKILNGLRIEFNSKEIEYTTQIDSLNCKLEDKNLDFQNLSNKYDLLEKEILELVIKLII